MGGRSRQWQRMAEIGRQWQTVAEIGRQWQRLADSGRPAGDDKLVLVLLPRSAGNQGSDPIRLVRMVNEMVS